MKSTKQPIYLGAVMGWFLHHTFDKVLNVVLISLFEFVNEAKINMSVRYFFFIFFKFCF